MDIDKLTPYRGGVDYEYRFGSLMDIDKLTLASITSSSFIGFGSLMDIDKLTQPGSFHLFVTVLVL